MIIDLQCPIRSAIFIYILGMIFLILYKPEMMNKEHHIFLATGTIFIAVFSYFIFIALSICV